MVFTYREGEEGGKETNRIVSRQRREGAKASDR